MPVGLFVVSVAWMWLGLPLCNSSMILLLLLLLLSVWCTLFFSHVYTHVRVRGHGVQ